MKGRSMRRLSLLTLLVILALVAVAPAAHATTTASGGPTATAAQQQPDRDGDGWGDHADNCPDQPGTYNGCPDRDGDRSPDSQDQCPDQPGQNNGCPDRDGDGWGDHVDKCPDESGRGATGGEGTTNEGNGCPDRPDRDNDRVADANDACPDLRGDQANGCSAFYFAYFFIAQAGLKDFAVDKRQHGRFRVVNGVKDQTFCRGGPQQCKSMHATFTLSAQSAKAAGISNRRIGSVSVAAPPFGERVPAFVRGISRANGKKLARMKKITVTIRAWAILTTGEKIETPAATITIYRNRPAGRRFASAGTPDET